MYLNLCPSTIGLSNNPFRTILDLAVANGFQGIDFQPGWFASAEEAAEAGEAVRAAGLKWGLFYLPTDFLQVSDDKFEEGMKRLDAMLPLVQAAGCTRTYNHIWPGSQDRTAQENMKWHVERLKRLHDSLQAHGVRIGLEFIGAKTLRDSFAHSFIYRAEQTLELIDKVSPEIGIVIDSFHWYTSGGTLEDLAACLPGRHIVNVHLNDAVPSRTREEQQDLERAMPLSTGVIDVRGLLGLLGSLEYDGPVICEPFRPTIDRFSKAAPADVAAEVAACMHGLGL